jgi:L-cysteine:1D-myo-inositol 2-amino-2-deoxy-alpha-D-glucopyranoside ligase
LDEVRGLLAADLDTVGAIAAVDRWVQLAMTAAEADADHAAPALVRELADALLGVAL